MGAVWIYPRATLLSSFLFINQNAGILAKPSMIYNAYAIGSLKRIQTNGGSIPRTTNLVNLARFSVNTYKKIFLYILLIHISMSYKTDKAGNRLEYGKGKTKLIFPNVAVRNRYFQRIRGKSDRASDKKYAGKKKKSSRILNQRVRNAMSGMGTRIFRQIISDRVLSPINEKTHATVNFSTVNIVEQALEALQYYDPSTPATLLTADGSAGTFSRKFMFTSAVAGVTFKNNYQTDCNISAYIVKPKVDTSITPLTAYTNGMADIGDPGNTQLMTYPTDSIQFNYLWKIVKSKTMMLRAGQTMKLNYNIGEFIYNPSITDNHALTYQRKIGGCALFISVWGTLGHDIVSDQQGLLKSGVDFEYTTKYKIIYDSGVELKEIVISNLLPIFSTGNPVQTSKPIADNISYQVV